jgi:hypothetical protein
MASAYVLRERATRPRLIGGIEKQICFSALKCSALPDFAMKTLDVRLTDRVDRHSFTRAHRISLAARRFIGALV